MREEIDNKNAWKGGGGGGGGIRHIGAEVQIIKMVDADERTSKISTKDRRTLGAMQT